MQLSLLLNILKYLSDANLIIYTESGGQLLLSLDFFISGKMLFEVDQHTSVIFCFENEVDCVLNASSHI
jgi:hypothetical protein